ncbi:DHH family phosphoesterase [Paenibacillus sacheonensis]|uniref:Bifunctional oligoribonuclease/PAP phosphatase NrnA n=1 Tax=Paenibacillus sacheonensis TaxID=742054 RepID=A0A7X5C195_9BACL|nr:bifunctional oligoribonuclease/PAP phosphatase NrnA [Paenibacillus sacheonensis]MBM7564658.1 phosphoesterase RecJ-like protein [Paenibacillus sacheonensis]NBC69214.1 bifunctional oligoribonuclease/PAP phosphatase NrnA [Paenibacillus sacheonensis]
MIAANEAFSASYRKQLQAALDFMRDGSKFLVVSHVQPDGDAISSTLVVGWFLRQLGKEAVLINEGAVPVRLNYLEGSDRVIHYGKQPPEEKFDRIIAVDCADFRRIGLVQGSFADQAQLLNIDHHPTNDAFGTHNIIRPDAAATVEILYDLIAFAGIPFDYESATAIYTGLLTDTGGFRYSNTSPYVMQIASRMLEENVNGPWIANHLLERMTKPQLLLLQRGLNRLTFSDDNQIAWLYVSFADMAETGAVGDDLEGLVNYALNVDGVEVGILFKETENGDVKVSMRSSGKADVSAIAQSFGGGGHVRAAGCRLQQGIQECSVSVIQAVREALDQ